MQKKGHCQTCKHCISLAFIYFFIYFNIHPLWCNFLKMRPSSRVFIHCVHQMPSIDSSFWPPKMRLFEGFSSTVHTWNEKKKNSLENFQLLWSWNETIWEDFHPQWSLPKQPKEALYKGQNSNFEWVTATVNTFGIAIWTAQLFVYIFFFVYIWVSCLFTFQFLLHISALAILFTLKYRGFKQIKNTNMA